MTVVSEHKRPAQSWINWMFIQYLGREAKEMVWCAVTELRRSGLRLKKSEVAPPTRGNLLMSERAQGNSSFKRAVRVVELWSEYAGNTWRRQEIHPLFEPQLVFMDAQSFVICGTQLETTDGRISEHTQVWLCRPLHERDAKEQPPVVSLRG